MPVAKHAVQSLQIVQGRPRRGHDISAVVPKHVLLEIEMPASGGHELPDARGLGDRDSLRIEGRLDEGQQRQLGGHVAQFQFLDDMEQVFA